MLLQKQKTPSMKLRRAFSETTLIGRCFSNEAKTKYNYITLKAKLRSHPISCQTASEQLNGDYPIIVLKVNV